MDEFNYKNERPWIKWLVSFGIGLAITIAFMAAQGVFSGELLKIDVVKYVSDGCFISGVLLAGAGILVFCSRNGTFDMLTYGVKVAVRTIFKTGENESFYDYKQRLGEKVTPCAFLIVPGLLFLIISGIFVGAFYQI